MSAKRKASPPPTAATPSPSPSSSAANDESAARAAAPDLSILGDQVTIHPPLSAPPPPSTSHALTSVGTPSSRLAAEGERNLIESMARFRTSPLDFLREVSLHVSGTGWRSYDNFVGQPIFYSGFSETMKSRTMGSAMLRAKIRGLAEGRVEKEKAEGLLNGGEAGSGRRLREIEGQLLQVADEWTDAMICKMESKRFIRGAYYLVTQLLTRAYHQGVHVSSEEVLRLRAIAQEAAKNKQSIVFLPSHRSHIDYVSLQIVCYRLGLALPTVVAGDNLNFPVVGPFLQHVGAMWIRRSFGEDQLYSTLVQAYMDTLLQNGYNVECFIEGGRSRTGKLLSPKFGILGFILDSIMSGRVNDTIICPVSTQYDKVLEVDSYISELLGQPKQKENLTDFLAASSILNLKLGRIDVRFHEPWSLKEFISEQQGRMIKLPQQITPQDVRVRILRTLGYRVLSEINDVSVVMPTALIGTVLLTLRGRGVGKSELVRRVDWLREKVKSRGGRVAHFAGLETVTVVERGLEVLGPNLVGIVQGLAEPTYYAVDRFQLSFYRNMTIHLFILEALVSAAMYTKVKLGGSFKDQRITDKDLRTHVYFLSQLFRGEFIFPAEGLDVNLETTLRMLEEDNIIRIDRDTDDPDIAFYAELTETERERGRENFDFFCFLIWPFIEASWLGAVSLMMLTPPWEQVGELWLDQKKVQDQAQLLGKTLYHQGDLSYFEAVNKETLKNAYQRFQEEGMVLVAKSKDAKVQSTMRLADEWLPKRDARTGRIRAEGRLWDFCEMVSQSRREGKNRRDGATVQTRVLTLADRVGSTLTAAGTVKDVQPVVEEVRSAKRRRREIVQTRARL